MVNFERFASISRLNVGRAGIPALCVLMTLMALVPWGMSQTPEFTLTPSALSPNAVAPGGVSSISIQVTPQTGFTGTANLSCAVTSGITTTDAPVCTVSPSSVSVPGNATANITTQTTTTTTLYSVAITGTDPATGYTTTSTAQNFTVLAVIPQFTITVTSAVTPTSVPAGSGAQGIISVNAANGYITPSGGITLSCGSMTPLVTIPPVCSFTYPNGASTLKLSGETAVSANLTISTFGPVTTTSRLQLRSFYSLWLSLPLLGLVGIGAATGGKRWRKACGILTLFVISASILLMPACSNTANTTSTPNGVTPANTYTFTILGVDSNGVVSSNISSTNTGPTVTLTVTAPPKT